MGICGRRVVWVVRGSRLSQLTIYGGFAISCTSPRGFSAHLPEFADFGAAGNKASAVRRTLAELGLPPIRAGKPWGCSSITFLSVGK